MFYSVVWHHLLGLVRFLITILLQIYYRISLRKNENRLRFGRDIAMSMVSPFYGKIGSPYSITERRVPELIPVLGSQPAGDVSRKPGGRLPLLPATPTVTPTTLKRAATNFATW